MFNLKKVKRLKQEITDLTIYVSALEGTLMQKHDENSSLRIQNMKLINQSSKKHK